MRARPAARRRAGGSRHSVTGLPDGRRCTTHWRHAAELARYCPAPTVDPDVLYVDADPVITSAGSARASRPAVAGFGNAMALRHHFRAWRGSTPAAYRSTFRAGASRRSARRA